jgi:predicted Fe-Mo cluster-binding NifX family protein
MVIAGGMGGRAQQLFLEQGVQVVVGAPVTGTVDVVSDYLAGKLVTGSNMCDH